jgi:hypothetical protein
MPIDDSDTPYRALQREKLARLTEKQEAAKPAKKKAKKKSASK